MLSYLSGVNQNNLKNNNMNKNEELGIYYPEAEIGKISLKNVVSNITTGVQSAVNTAQQTAQTAVNTVQSQIQSAIQSTQDALKGINVDKVKHDIAKVYFVLPRGAFLVLLRLGGALEQTPIKVNLAKRMAEMWPSKGTQIKQRWYDFGGDIQELVNIVNIASKQPSISGMSYLGEPVTTATATAATTATAAPILASIMALLGSATAFLSDPKNQQAIGIGKAVAEKALAAAAQNNPANKDAVQNIGNMINTTLPSVTMPVTSQQVNTATNTASGVVDGVKSELAPPQSTSNNKMIYIIGGVAALGLGALFLLKRNKNK
jgi:LPXTG-motif cell wall-anchored protein